MADGIGFLFVRFIRDSKKEEGDSTYTEHCVAESGWQVDLWECPCAECDSWRPKWRHLFAALWGAKAVFDHADIDYNDSTVPTAREWVEMGLDKDYDNAGITWECHYWDDYFIPEDDPIAEEEQDACDCSIHSSDSEDQEEEDSDASN
jgi:hypothetical protein